jgi:isoquinoline 1-oxidoreductase alpha subunit
VKLTVNEKVYEIDVDPDTPLLWVIRDHLQLTGTKFGCGKMLCGACTVFLGEEIVQRSCLLPVSSVNLPVTTIEGLTGKVGEAVKAAWIKHQVAQCGYCQSGQILTATALLKRNPAPSDEDIDSGMNNICRCGTYVRMRDAIKEAATNLGENQHV